jgi:hypothetical protein
VSGGREKPVPLFANGTGFFPFAAFVLRPQTGFKSALAVAAGA